MATHVLKYSKFATFHSGFMDKIYKSYLGKMNIPKVGSFSILDIGCGDGKILNNVLIPNLPENCEEIVATDIDEDMIAYCKKLKTKRNVHYMQMNIDTEELPDSLKNRFSSIFSSMCFMYVRNIRQSLLNCNVMLKKDRDVLLVFFPRKNPLFDTYAEMSKIDAWKPYLKDFSGYLPHFSSDNPYSEAKKLFEDAGLKLMNMEFQTELFQSNRRNYLEINRSMDFVFRTIPSEKQTSYLQDFTRVVSDVYGMDLVDERKLDTPTTLPLPIITLHGRKL